MAELEAEADRISLLPLDIKLSILSCLRIKDAVRTSALARSWRHLWTHLPCLHLKTGLDPLSNTGSSSWIQRVHRLVSSLRGPLLVFQLHFVEVHFFDDDRLVFQSLLDLLLQKGGLQILDLFFHLDLMVIHLPSFHSLRVLKLYGCHVVLPTDFRGFHRLETLEIKTALISNDDLNLLLRTSNNLTSLVILDCHPSGNLLSVNLSFPLLRHLEFEVNMVVENLSVVSIPCLEHAAIKLGEIWLHQILDTDTDNSLQNLAPMLLRLVTSVAMVSSLILGFDVLKRLSLVILPFNFTIPRLRFLMFYLDLNTMDRRVYDAFLWLLRSMPFLEELQVNLQMTYDQAGRVAILMRELLVKKHDGFACLERTITIVTINMLTLDVIASIAWIQFFILNAKGLKLLKIGYFSGGDLIPSFIKELQKVEVTFSGAKVIFFNRGTYQETNLCIND
ncbi:hypothetical protein LUZ61_015430 [Rhynchospora tenuis]|uniref:F-box domain-containing protein n=1 Tax=Rhynchospora tenuis TaxID=198213 RepID=A0AAD5WCR2_9POAL|nr:hypothetical protein LUZ61_015430 [Rhynchospora tenuis]